VVLSLVGIIGGVISFVVSIAILVFSAMSWLDMFSVYAEIFPF